MPNVFKRVVETVRKAWFVPGSPPALNKILLEKNDLFAEMDKEIEKPDEIILPLCSFLTKEYLKDRF